MTKIIAWHGTTRTSIDKHSSKKHRTPLNEQYQGDWFCYTQSEDVAWKYADAARNQNIDRDLFFEDLKLILNKSNHPQSNYIYTLCENIVDFGYDEGFEKTLQQFKDDIKQENHEAIFFQNVIKPICDDELKFDINDLCDLLQYIEGSKYHEIQDDLTSIVDLLNSRIQHLPHYIYGDMEAIGFSSSIPRATVIKSEITANKILHTKNPEEAKNAILHGYDTIIYSGEGTVDGEPEILVANTKQIKFIEKITRFIESIDDYQGDTTIHYSFKTTPIKTKRKPHP